VQKLLDFADVSETEESHLNPVSDLTAPRHVTMALAVENEVGPAFEVVRAAIFDKNGWRKDSVKVGDIVTVDGSRGRQGEFRVGAHRVRLSDGRLLLARL